jgi:hypothetical protein
VRRFPLAREKRPLSVLVGKGKSWQFLLKVKKHLMDDFGIPVVVSRHFSRFV